MAYKLGADGKWTQIPESGGGGGGAGGNKGTKIDNGNVSESQDAISETTKNKEEKTKYTETATAKILGATNCRMGNWLVIQKGVADRWLGKWLILETTHTIDAKGYTIDVNIGREPAGGSGGGGGSGGSGSTTSSSTPPSEKTAAKSTPKTPAASTSDKVWKLQADGKWVQQAK